MKAMDGPSSESALSFPLPENPSTELLNRARQGVLIDLDFVLHDIASAGDADEIRTEITRAAARLIEISIHWRPACDAEREERLAEERFRDLAGCGKSGILGEIWGIIRAA